MPDRLDDTMVLEGPALLRRRRLLRVAFWVYAAMVFTATHWPKLELPGPKNSDKVVHMTVFGLWMFIATTQRWFGALFSTKNILATMVVSLVYAAVDEGLQAFKFVHRDASLEDYSANAAGIVLVTIVFFAVRGRWSARGAAS
jgi:VanZ family protein